MFYWFDSSDNIVCGPFATAALARRAGESDANAGTTVNIVRKWQVSEAPQLQKRKFTSV